MREIKFRAWDSKEGRMIYNAQNAYDCGAYYGVDLSVSCFGEVLEDSERYAVEQYTGLKDKNGKEIYEGDIMSDGNIVRFALDDEVGSCGCCYDAFFGSGFIVATDVPPDCLEIIGNIHESRELLNGGKNERE